MNAMAYLRVSTDKQADSGLGIEAQQAACEQWAAANGYDLQVFVDEGISGAADIADRPALLDALQAIGKGDVLLVAKRDRLSRKRTNMGLIEYMIEKAGARLVSVAGEGTDEEDPMSALIQSTIFDLLAQMERIQASVRTKAAMAAKRRRGEYLGGVVPFGQRLAADGVRLETDQDEASILDVIKRLQTEGLSLRAIADELNRRGIHRRDGQAWHHVAVTRAIKGAA
jgi:site-specific DNA recombinase